MNKTVTELTKRKYVFATLSSPTTYLVSQHWGRWCFTDNLEIATKAISRNVAEIILGNYYHDLGHDIPLVIVPIEIEYKLINEVND